MNGGQVATRGFLLQTLIALLDVLLDIDRIDAIQLEPSTDKDKTDFVIDYNGGKRKAVQVKSSQNQIGLPSAKKWARKLKDDLVADDYELCLIGPCSGDLAKTTEIDGVKLPVVKSLDVKGMLEQACHRLDAYLDKKNVASGGPVMRQLIVEGLIGKLSTYSTAGTPVTGAAIHKVFEDWRSVIQKQAVEQLKREYGDGSLSDADALKEYSAHFDRAALQDSLHGCWNYKRFAEALGNLIELLNTGQVRGVFVAKRRADFANSQWKEWLTDVYHGVRKLRGEYTRLVRLGEIDEESCGCNCPPSVVDEFEQRKRSIVSQLNRVLQDAGLAAIRGLE